MEQLVVESSVQLVVNGAECTCYRHRVKKPTLRIRHASIVYSGPRDNRKPSLTLAASLVVRVRSMPITSTAFYICHFRARYECVVALNEQRIVSRASAVWRQDGVLARCKAGVLKFQFGLILS